jgi:LPXTG-motif cell wall-anchored protein
MRVSKGQRGAPGRVREVALFICMAVALLLMLAPSAFAGGVGAAATPAARAAQAPEDTSGVNEYTEQGVPGEPSDNATGSPESGQSAPGSRSKGSQGAGAAGSQGAGAADASGSQRDRADDNAAAGSRPTATTGAGDQSTQASTLPRTGIDAWLLVMAGFALLGSGLLLRWAEVARPVGLFSPSRNARGVYLKPAGPQAGFGTKSR